MINQNHSREILPGTYRDTSHLRAALETRLSMPEVRASLHANSYYFRAVLQAVKFRWPVIENLKDTVLLLDCDIIRDYADPSGGPHRDSSVIRSIIESGRHDFAIPLGAFEELIGWLLQTQLNIPVRISDTSPHGAISKIASYLEDRNRPATGNIEHDLRILEKKLKPKTVIVQRLFNILDNPRFQGVASTYDAQDEQALVDILSQAIHRDFRRDRRDRRDAINLSIALSSWRASWDGPKYVLLTGTKELYNLLSPDNPDKAESFFEALGPITGSRGWDISERFPVLGPYMFWAGWLAVTNSQHKQGDLNDILKRVDDINELSGKMTIESNGAAREMTQEERIKHLANALISLSTTQTSGFDLLIQSYVVEASSFMAKTSLYPRTYTASFHNHTVETFHLAELMWKLRNLLIKQGSAALKVTSLGKGSFAIGYEAGQSQHNVLRGSILSIERGRAQDAKTLYVLAWPTDKSIRDCLKFSRRFLKRSRLFNSSKLPEGKYKFRRVDDVEDRLFKEGIVVFTSHGSFGTDIRFLNQGAEWARISQLVAAGTWDSALETETSVTRRASQFPEISCIRINTPEYEVTIDVKTREHLTCRNIAVTAVEDKAHELLSFIESTSLFKFIPEALLSRLEEYKDSIMEDDL